MFFRKKKSRVFYLSFFSLFFFFSSSLRNQSNPVRAFLFLLSLFTVSKCVPQTTKNSTKKKINNFFTP